MLEMVGLEDRSGDLVERFSGGMKRRLEIARGLVPGGFVSPEALVAGRRASHASAR